MYSCTGLCAAPGYLRKELVEGSAHKDMTNERTRNRELKLSLPLGPAVV